MGGGGGHLGPWRMGPWRGPAKTPIRNAIDSAVLTPRTKPPPVQIEGPPHVSQHQTKMMMPLSRALICEHSPQTCPSGGLP